MNWLAKYSDFTYALMRIVSGLLFTFHGAQKILGVLADSQPEFGTQMWFGGLIELVGGLMIAVGFQTRYAAFLSSGTMAVAYIQFHWNFAVDSSFFPAINKGELAVVYCFVFFYIACRGAGMLSMDKKS